MKNAIKEDKCNLNLKNAVVPIDIIHTVKEGESLYYIRKKYNIDVRK